MALDAAPNEQRASLSVPQLLGGQSGIRSGMRPRAAGGGLAPRLLALCMLCGVVAALAFAGHTTYWASRDSFVAPAILSPDSEVVIANKLRLSELAVERERAAAAIEGIDAEVAADDRGIAKLENLRPKLDNAVHWTAAVTSEKAAAANAELADLHRQRQIMSGMMTEQKDRAESAQRDVEAGVISRSDYAKQEQTLSQFQLALLENERATLQRESEMRETLLAQRALLRPQQEPLTPELMAHEDQIIRVEIEEMQLEANKRSKLAERAALSERIGKLDELVAQLKGRPFCRAMAESVDVAFVPYTQLDGVDAGATVYSCLWGLFLCQPVGTVSDMVGGEVILPDPWGTPQRGQYAVLRLSDRGAARSKTLRVRSDGAPVPKAPGMPVADR